MLAHPDPALPLVVDMDAFSTAIGAVLTQWQGPKQTLCPSTFFSRELTPAEQNYEILDQKPLTIHATFREWQYYLDNHFDFHICTSPGPETEKQTCYLKRWNMKLTPCRCQLNPALF